MDESTAVAASNPRGGYRAGFLAMLPLWAGVVPFGVAFAVLARAAGFSAIATQALSLLVFAGAAQVATVRLVGDGALPLVVVLTAFLLNLRHVLYGLSYRRLAGRLPGPPAALLAFLLTDEAYGVTVRAFMEGRGSGTFLLGAGSSLYFAFNLATLAGALLGSLLPDPRASGLDFVFPLTFLALLLPVLRSRRQVLVAAVSGAGALGLSRVAPGGVTVLVSAVTAAALGTVLDERENEAP